MNPSLALAASSETHIVGCQVAAAAVVRATPDAVPALRRNPGPPVREPMSPALLKHADPQTVAGVAAVLRAIAAHQLATTCFRDWGVLAGSSLVGREKTAESLERFLVEGAFAISPHLIPHESLHACSGTISQILAIHGPNFGVGGGPGAAEDTLTAAATLLSSQTLPGLWVVLTDLDPEWSATERPWLCHAVALALTRGRHADAPALEICATALDRPADLDDAPTFALPSFADALEGGVHAARSWRFHNGGWLWLSPWGDGMGSARE